MIRGCRVVSNRWVSAAGAMLLAWSLAGCAGRVAAGVAADTQRVAAAPAPDLVFAVSDGTRLPARQWLPPVGVAWRGVILALHGFADSRDAWEMPGPVFAAAGYAVFAPDLRGFGATATRGTWPGAAALEGDATQLLAQLRVRYPGQRLILMGESMGGAVALCLAARHPAPADAFVLLAPAVLGRAQMGPVLSGTLWLADGVAPGWHLTGQEIPLDIAASDNREALLRLAHDPLSLRSSSVSMLAGLVDLMDAAQATAADLHGAVLVLAGRRDQVVPTAAMAAAWSRLPTDVRRGFYLGGYHLLMRDQDRALVDADVLSWLADPGRWLPSGADINAAAWQADHGFTPGPAAVLPAQALDGYGERSTWPF